MTSIAWQMTLNELANIVGQEHVHVSEQDRLAYAVDAYWTPRVWIDRGRTPELPDAVVAPGSVAEIVDIVRLANLHRIPLIPYGGGSNSQGCIIPVHGGITVDLKRLNKIKDINEHSGFVVAEAGINGFALESALNRAGWTLPHYPASVHAATLGGYLACRGSGTVSTKYGKAEDLVMSIEVVLPNGELMRTLPVPNHAAGPGTLQLFVGAEGTFGFITEATMRLEQLPEVRRFRSFLFPDVKSGMEAGRRIMLQRLQPCVMRLYDERSTIRTVKHVLGTDVDRGAYMVIGFDGFEDIVAVQERRAFSICAELNAEDLGAEAGQHWWDHRYDFYFPPEAPDLPWMFGTLDTVCTFDRMEALVAAKKQRLESQFRDWKLYYYAHFSHWFPWGVMVYDRFVIERPPADPDEAIALHDAVWTLAVQTNLEYGGVINEHHGVGLKLARFVRQQFGEGFQVLEGVKDRIDPHHLLNPGKMGFGGPR